MRKEFEVGKIYFNKKDLSEGRKIIRKVLVTRIKPFRIEGRYMEEGQNDPEEYYWYGDSFGENYMYFVQANQIWKDLNA